MSTEIDNENHRIIRVTKTLTKKVSLELFFGNDHPWAYSPVTGNIIFK